MKMNPYHSFSALALILIGTISLGQDEPAANGPVAYVFANPRGVELRAYVFSPKLMKAGPRRAAIVLFHGGGWVAGEPAWAFGRARHFAEHGMIAVAAQYRLSNHMGVTPLDAIDDARAAIRWVRSHADDLGIDPKRIAAYGWSAGAHLAVCTAVFNRVPTGASVSCAPNALVLESPAVSIGRESLNQMIWPQLLLGFRCMSSDISPDEHIRSGLPPTVIVEGRQDTVTPLRGVKLFVDRMKAAGNRCDLYLFDGVGHLFTPVGTPDSGPPHPDPTVEAAAFSKLDEFLVSMSYMQ